MKFDAANRKTRPTALAGKSPADFSQDEVLREFATSKDGTRIPMNIIRRKKTKLDGGNPVLLYGYGGYGISLTPGFAASRSLWLDQGGVYVVATCAAAGNMARSGTRPATSRTNRTSSTISSPLPNT